MDALGLLVLVAAGRAALKPRNWLGFGLGFGLVVGAQALAERAARLSPPTPPLLEGVVLADAQGARRAPATCEATACLVVHLRTDCGLCRQVHPQLSALRDALQSQGLPTTFVVVGDGETDAYGEGLGVETLLDSTDASLVRGAPHFTLVDRSGARVAHWGGLPQAPADLTVDHLLDAVEKRHGGIACGASETVCDAR